MDQDRTYLDTLLLYYEEEIEGEAYFTALAEAFEGDDHRQKLRLLADVERHAAKGVRPLIEKYGLHPRSTGELVESGHRDARQTAKDWAALIAEMNRTYPGYTEAFRALEAMGPAEDQGRLSFLTEHEVAAMKFLALEAKDPGRSAQPLQAYIAMAPETWMQTAE